MYLVRRICRTQPGKAWEVASYLAKICEAYEKVGRDKARIYFTQGLPGDKNVVYCEWTQESIQPTDRSKVPQSVFEDDPKMQALLTAYDLELYEVVTKEKLQGRGLA